MVGGQHGKEDKMNTAVFVTARSDSTRLPGKMLKTINSIPVIEHVINRAKLVKAGKTILCTTDRSCDDKLVEIGKGNNIDIFRGDLNRINRWANACMMYNIDTFVNFDADDLFASIELMQLSLNLVDYISSVEYVCASEKMVCGAFTYAFRRPEILRIAHKYNNYYKHEWQTFDAFCNPTYILNQKHSVYYGNERLTLDYKEDLQFFRKVFSEVPDIWKVNLSVILKYLRQNPDWCKINAFRQEDFLRGQERI